MEARAEISPAEELLQELLAEVRALRAEKAREEDEFLQLADLYSTKDRKGLLPFSRPTVEKMRDDGRLPMICIDGRWIMSRRSFREASDRGFPKPRGLRIRTRSRT